MALENKDDDIIEINLKELVTSVYKQKKLIIMITGIIVVLTAVFLLITKRPVYEATSSVVLNPPTTVATRFGEYKFPSSNVFSNYIQYITSDAVLDDLIEKYSTKEVVLDRKKLRASISVEYEDRDNYDKDDKDTKVFSNKINVKVRNKDALTAQQMNADLLQWYDTYMRVTNKKMALDDFIKSYEIAIKTEEIAVEQDQLILNQKKALLSTMEPTFTLKKGLVSNPSDAIRYAGSLDSSNDVINEEFRNDDYTKLNSECVDRESKLLEAKQKLEKNQRLYDQLIAENDTFTKAVEDKNYNVALNSVLDVFKNSMHVTMSASIPDTFVPRNRLKYTAIAGIIGLFFSLLIAVCRYFWHKN
ncbi:MAG: hypothetical protein BKP49_07885 [Treponema sp. CETP13]|nr:MAG: hypothetical protein BKP49_07885 [Treponema sp. CETP13]